MFESLFTRPSVIARYRSAPLLEERIRYLAHCAQIGFKTKMLCEIGSYQLNLVRALGLHDGDDDLNLRKIGAWCRRPSLPNDRILRSRASRLFFHHAEQWLRFLGWFDGPEVARPAHTYEVTAFATHLSVERGWSDATIEDCCRTVNCFFVWLDDTGVDLASVSFTMIDQAIARYQARGCCRSTTYLYAQRLRRFFQFAEQQGWCNPGLADGIMPPRRYPGEGIPQGLNRDEVIRLLATTEGDNLGDIRDRAILMLLITYGLRAGEVCGLQLDDLNWKQEMLRVRCPKPGRTHLYPLSQHVGQAVLHYLREVRPSQPERRLFLTLRAPIKPVSRKVIREIVYSRLDRLGVTGKRRGPHALRHAAAQHLLDQGLPIKVVGDYLGHRSVAATSVYAKVQLNTLREVAEIDLEGLA